MRSEEGPGSIPTAVSYFTTRAVISKEEDGACATRAAVAVEATVASAEDVEAAVAAVLEPGSEADAAVPTTVSDSSASEGQQHNGVAVISTTDAGHDGETSGGGEGSDVVDDSGVTAKDGGAVVAVEKNSPPADGLIRQGGGDGGDRSSSEATEGTLPTVIKQGDAGTAVAEGGSAGEGGGGEGGRAEVTPLTTPAITQDEVSTNVHPPVPTPSTSPSLVQPQQQPDVRSGAIAVETTAEVMTGVAIVATATTEPPLRPSSAASSGDELRQEQPKKKKREEAAIATTAAPATADGEISTPSDGPRDNLAQAVPTERRVSTSGRGTAAATVVKGSVDSTPPSEARATAGKRPRSPTTAQALKRPRPSSPPPPPGALSLAAGDVLSSATGSVREAAAAVVAAAAVEVAAESGGISCACPGLIVWAPRGDGEIQVDGTCVECLGMFCWFP